jgi:hypothetical protein
MLWLIMCVKNGSYLILMEIGVKWPLNIDFLIWMGQVSIFWKQEIGHTEDTLSFKHFSRMETWPTHIEKSILIAVLHLFSIETAYEPSLTHIINQTIIKVDIRI